MRSDYDLVKTYLGIEEPFAVESAFTTRTLDPAMKNDVSKVPKCPICHCEQQANPQLLCAIIASLRSQ